MLIFLVGLIFLDIGICLYFNLNKRYQYKLFDITEIYGKLMVSRKYLK